MSTENNNQPQVIYVDQETANGLAIGQAASSLFGFQIVISGIFILFFIQFKKIALFVMEAGKAGELGPWIYVIGPIVICISIFLLMVIWLTALSIEETPTLIVYTGIGYYLIDLLYYPLEEGLEICVALHISFFTVYILSHIPKIKYVLGVALAVFGAPYLYEIVLAFLKAVSWL